MLCDLKGERVAVVEMRSHVPWYLKGVPGSARIRDRVNTSRTLEDLLEAME